MQTYSLKKGFSKGVASALTALAALVAFAGFSDLQIWDLVVQYVKPVVGSITVGGAITIALNYVKVKSKV